VDYIELDVEGHQIDFIYNENNAFEVFQQKYGIKHPIGIPIRCLVGNYWLQCLRYRKAQFFPLPFGTECGIRQFLSMTVSKLEIIVQI
jgi:hypothetical protein